MIYVRQNGLGSWLSRTVANIAYVEQQVDIAAHAANELGVGKTVVGQILVPTSSNLINQNQTIDKKPLVLTTVDATNCARSEFKNDPRCVSFLKTQQVAVQTQQIIATPEQQTFDLKNKSTLLIGGGILLAIGLVIVASTE